MDKTQSIGFALLIMLIFGWSYFNAPSEAEIAEHKRLTDSIEQIQVQESLNPTTIDQANQAEQVTKSIELDSTQLNQKYGDLGAVMTGQGEEIMLSNDLVKVTLNSKGGRITKAELSKYKQIVVDKDHNETKIPLVLMGNDKGRFEYILPTQSGQKISTQDIVYNATKSANKVSFVANTENGSIEHSYTLLPGQYVLDYQFSINGVRQMLDPSVDKIRFRWQEYLNKLEVNQTFEKFYSTIYYKKLNENSDYCSCRGDDEQDEEGAQIEWMAHTNQFFNTSIISKNNNFENAIFETKLSNDESPYIKMTKGEGDLALSGDNNATFDFQIFLGPNEYERLVTFHNGLEEIIPFGRSIFGSINRHLIRPAFNFLSKYIGNKGIVLIILIFIIKMMVYPLTYKMLHSQAKMGALKPKLASLTEKFKDDPTKKQMETMKIYREYGVSPLGGCMPMIVQMPIWYALFRFFPASITFRQESFLWATDLSSYDNFINLPFTIPAYGAHVSLFTILWAVSTIIYSYYNTKHMDMSANPAMKYVQYFMPVMFLFFFNNYSSGLTCYMFFSNLFTIMQTIITKKLVFNDEKILAELEVKKSTKPVKKKNSFQQRLEEAMKQQQEVQAKRGKKK